MTIALEGNREATVDNLINCGFTYGFEVEKIEAGNRIGECKFN